MMVKYSDLAPLYRVAEETYLSLKGRKGTVASQLFDWMGAEVTFRTAVGCTIFTVPWRPPQEPCQMELWENIATILREVRVREYGSQFSIQENA